MEGRQEKMKKGVHKLNFEYEVVYRCLGCPWVAREMQGFLCAGVKLVPFRHTHIYTKVKFNLQ